jgi:glycosyltransferase involved in cell wall biosynthesis
MAKISVIVPCYNYAHYLPFALDSVLAQTFHDWECIIVDDGSKDDSARVARSYVVQDGRFKYVYQQNSGLSAARNTGIENCTGIYLQFLDADDLIETDKLQLQSNYLEAHTDVDIVYGDERFFHTDAPGNKLKGRNKQDNKFQYLKGSGSGATMVKAMSVDNHIAVSAPMVRRSLVSKIGVFDTTYRSYEDWHFWFRAAVAGAKFAHEPVPGTETYIRFGHGSMLTVQSKLTEAGIRIRKFMMPQLQGNLKAYNLYRLLKLYARKILNR